MAMAEQIISSEMSKETVDFLKIQRALIEFAQQVGAERIGVEVNDRDRPQTSCMVTRQTRSSRLIISHTLRRPRSQTERGLSLADCGLGYIPDYDAD